MAYVAITQRLKDEVSGTITRMCKAELGATTSIDSAISAVRGSQEIQLLANNVLWKPLEDLRGRLAPYNIQAQANVTVRHEGDHHHVGVIYVENAPCAAEYEDSYGRNRVNITLDSDEHPLLAEFVTVRRNYEEINTRWQSVQAQILGYLNSCKSLNEALKLWPDVARYVPSSYVDKVNEKALRQAQEASQALQALKGLDLDKINTSTVLARMAGVDV